MGQARGHTQIQYRRHRIIATQRLRTISYQFEQALPFHLSEISRIFQIGHYTAQIDNFIPLLVPQVLHIRVILVLGMIMRVTDSLTGGRLSTNLHSELTIPILSIKTFRSDQLKSLCTTGPLGIPLMENHMERTWTVLLD
jgi:hypothetical protein